MTYVAQLRPEVLRRGVFSLAAALLASAFFTTTEGWSGMGHVALGAVVALGLMLDVQLPQGGSVPMGHTFLMALAYALPAEEYTLVATLGLLLAMPGFVQRHGVERAAVRLLGLFVAATAAGVVSEAVRSSLSASVDPHAPKVALFGLLVAGLAYLAVDLLGTVLLTAESPRSSAWPVYVTLLCAAALLAMAYHQGWWMLLFAALPLLMTRFSFQRYSVARRTYQQTIQALGIVPELAGHASLGHGERTASYVGAVARELGFADSEIERLVTAARLHHIGHISISECDGGDRAADRRSVGRAGADLLRETGFLADVADLVEAIGMPADVAARTDLRAAVVRVATAFDDLVVEDAARASGALALLDSQHRDRESQTALAALRRLVERDRAVVTRAIAEGAPLTRAAADAAREHAVV